MNVSATEKPNKQMYCLVLLGLGKLCGTILAKLKYVSAVSTSHFCSALRVVQCQSRGSCSLPYCL